MISKSIILTTRFQMEGFNKAVVYFQIPLSHLKIICLPYKWHQIANNWALCHHQLCIRKIIITMGDIEFSINLVKMFQLIWIRAKFKRNRFFNLHKPFSQTNNNLAPTYKRSHYFTKWTHRSIKIYTRWVTNFV